MVRSSPSAYSSSKQNRPTGTSRAASAIPCLRRRYITSPNGRSSLAAGSYAITSPSTIASRGPSPVCSSSSTSGNWALTRSCRRVNSSISPVGGAVRLDPHAVVLVLRRAPAAELGQDLLRHRQPLGEHHPDRMAGPDPQLLHRLQAAGDQRRGDQAEVAADVVRPLEHRPLLADRRRAPRPARRGWSACRSRAAGCRSPAAAGSAPPAASPARCSPAEQVELAALRAGARRRGDLQQRVDDLLDLQSRRPILGRRSRRPAARRPDRGRRSRRTIATTSSAGRPIAVPTARTAIFSATPRSIAGELRRHHPLAEVADRRQLLVGRLPDQLGQPGDQRQAAGGLLEVVVRLGDDGIVHAAIIAQPAALLPRGRGRPPPRSVRNCRQTTRIRRDTCRLSAVFGRRGWQRPPLRGQDSPMGVRTVTVSAALILAC